MRHLLKFGEGVNTIQLLNAIFAKGLTRDNLVLRGVAASDLLECANHEEMSDLPGALQMAVGLLAATQATRLGGVQVRRVETGQTYGETDDGSDYAAYYTRYYVMLQALPGCVVRCAEEASEVQTGQVWVADKDEDVEFANNSPDELVLMLVDVRIE